MGRKRRIISARGKFANKFSAHPLMKAVLKSKTDTETTILPDPADLIVEEAKTTVITVAQEEVKAQTETKVAVSASPELEEVQSKSTPKKVKKSTRAKKKTNSTVRKRTRKTKTAQE